MSDNRAIPLWVKAELFEQVLRKDIENFKQIKKFQVRYALAPGENYATIMLKVYIDCILKDGQTKEQTYMLKVAHDSELQRTELVKWHMFATESGMYRDIVPAFEKLYSEKGLSVKFGAKAYSIPTKEEYILLEDLTRRGFRNVKRQDCLNMDHCKGVLKKQAQFHAASVVWMERNGSYSEIYTKGMVRPEGRNLMGSMLTSGYKHVLKAIESMNLDKAYYQQLKNYSDHLVDSLYEQTTFDESDFNVLNHGDCWSNNIMFQYNSDGSLKETYFVDLQMPRYGSPAQDLLYFIFSSAQYDLKINRFDEMIRYYYDQLIEHLNLLEYSKPMPYMRDIHRMIIKSGVWGILTVLVTMAAVLCDPTDTATVDNFVSDSQESEEFKAIMFSNERFKKHLAIVIPWLCNRGVFQV